LSDATDIDPKEYVEVLGILKNIDFLQGVGDEDLNNILFFLQKQAFPKGRKIIFQGEIANRLLILRKGSVSITTKHKGSKLTLAELKPPMYVGEISLLRPMSATATVTSGDEGAEALILSHEAMSHLAKNIPDIEKRIQNVIDARIASKNQAKKKEEEE